MAELRRRKLDEDSALDTKSEQIGDAGSDGGTGTDDDTTQQQHQHQQKRKSSSGLNTADSSDHVNIHFYELN